MDSNGAEVAAMMTDNGIHTEEDNFSRGNVVDNRILIENCNGDCSSSGRDTHMFHAVVASEMRTESTCVKKRESTCVK